MKYCYRCPDCGSRYEMTVRDAHWCPECGGYGLLRDYRAEGVGIGSGVRTNFDPR